MADHQPYLPIPHDAVHRRCEKCGTDYWFPKEFIYFACRCGAENASSLPSVVFPPSATDCARCGHWADWHHKQKDGTFPCIGRCGCLDYEPRECHYEWNTDAHPGPHVCWLGRGHDLSHLCCCGKTAIENASGLPVETDRMRQARLMEQEWWRLRLGLKIEPDTEEEQDRQDQ